MNTNNESQNQFGSNVQTPNNLNNLNQTDPNALNQVSNLGTVNQTNLNTTGLEETNLNQQANNQLNVNTANNTFNQTTNQSIDQSMVPNPMQNTNQKIDQSQAQSIMPNSNQTITQNNIPTYNPPLPDSTGIPNVANSTQTQGDINTSSPKPNKKKTILIIIIVLIALILTVGLFFYFKEFKSGNKKIESTISRLTYENKSFKKDDMEKLSGNFALDIKASAMSYTLNANMALDYSIDTKNNKFYSNININKLEIPNLIKSRADLKLINLEVYASDETAYLNSKGVTNNIYNMPLEELGGYYDDTKEFIDSDIDYDYLHKKTIEALKQAIPSLEYNQGIKTETIDGKETKVNVVTINANNDNMTKYFKKVKEILSNDSNYSAYMNKIDPEFFNDEDFYSDTTIKDANIYVMSDIFNDELKLVKYDFTYTDDNDEKKARIEITPVNDGLEAKYYDNDKLAITIKLNLSETNGDSIKSETNLSIKAESEFVNQAGITGVTTPIEISIKLENTKDKEYKEKKMDIVNSKSVSEISDAEIETITGNLFTKTIAAPIYEAITSLFGSFSLSNDGTFNLNIN